MEIRSVVVFFSAALLCSRVPCCWAVHVSTTAEWGVAGMNSGLEKPNQAYRSRLGVETVQSIT